MESFNDSGEIEFGFWFWSKKLTGVLVMLSYLCGSKIDEEEMNIIKLELIGTNDEENKWIDYEFNGEIEMTIKLAYDGAEGTDITHVQIKTIEVLKEKLEALDLFQSLFTQLELN